jgi:hypothetical protein
MITIHNLETGEIIQRELNDDELAQKAKDEAAQLAFIQAQAEAATKREAAIAKLAALGLEPDDLKALGLA